MNDLSVRLVNDASGFNSSMEEATRHVQDFAKETDKASDEVKKFGADGAKSAKDLIKEMSAISGAERNLHNYKRQLSQITKDIQDLTINYRNMSAEMKSSELGQEALAKIQELTVKAGEYKDAIMDAQGAIRAVASDTAVWDAAKQGIDALSGGLQAFVSMGVLGEQSTEKLVAVLAKLKAIEVSTNAVIKIGNALQRNSALMMGISKVQALALAAAKRAEASGTVAATVAQRAFNAVAKANPYILLASAVIAVGSALLAFAKNEKEASEAEKAHQEALKKQEEEMHDYRKIVYDNVASVMSKYKLLQIEWNKLQTTAQKKRWIEDNKNAFIDLGISIDNVNTAERAFVSDTDNFINAIKKRAQVLAKQSQLVELYKKLYEAQQRVDEEYERQKVSYGDKYYGSIDANFQQGVREGYYGTNYHIGSNGPAEFYTQKGADRANAQLRARLTTNLTSGIQRDIDALAGEIEGMIDISQIIRPTTGGNNNTVQAVAGSLQAAQNEVSRLQTMLNNMAPDNTKFEETKQALIDAQAEVERLKKVYATVSEQELFPEGSLKEANHFVQVFTQQLQELDPNSDEFAEVLELLNLWKAKVQEINDLINNTKEDIPVGTLAEANEKVSELTQQLTKLVPGTEEFERILALLNEWRKKQEDIADAINKTNNASSSKVDKYKEIVSQASDISMQVQIGEISPEEGRRQIAKLNEKLRSMNLSAKVELEFDTNLSKFNQKMNEVKDMVSAPINAINSVVSSYKSMMDTLEDPDKGPWEQFFSVFQFGISIIEGVSTVLTILNTITQLLAASKAENTAATIAETTAASSDATAQAADAAATTTNAAAHGAAAAAEAGQSVASIPYVGPVLAIAAIAAVMAAIIGILASAKGFAEGGIIGGHSYTGDKILARVNSGELILNQHQQGRLLSMMENADTYNQPNVKFEISGSNLVGVLRNNQKKNSKL